MLGISAGVAELDSDCVLMCRNHIVFRSPTCRGVNSEYYDIHISIISLIMCQATLDLRSFSARLDSASRSLEAASSSWRLAMLSSGTSSLWVLTS